MFTPIKKWEGLKSNVLASMYKGGHWRLLFTGIVLDFWKYFSLLYKLAGYIFFRNPVDPVEYFVVPNRGIIYLVNSKCACSSIKKALLAMDSISKDAYVGKTVHKVGFEKGYSKFKLDASESIFLTFTVVRNPYERLVSSYVNKFLSTTSIHRNKFQYAVYFGGVVRQDFSFEEYVRFVCGLPDGLSDRHFRSQSFLIESLEDIECVAVRLEDVKDGIIRLDNTLEIDIGIKENASENYDYREFYNRELFEMVAERYRKDIVSYGYEDEERELELYIEKNTASIL